MKILFGIFLCLLPFFSFAHEEESSVLISITNKGFEPSTLSIAPHTKVVFINRDNESHWPASDRHPTHSDYGGTNLETHCSDDYNGPPAFDSCRALAESETWSFVFEEAGTFNYHDHVWSHLGGTIIVEEERQKTRLEVWIESFIKWVKSFFTVDIEEVEQELIALVNNQDPRVALEELRKKGLHESKVESLCHDLAHEIGRAAFIKYKNLEQSTVFQDPYCNSGYLHGIFEQYFTDNELDLKTLHTLCDNLKLPFDSFQCNHGMGHGLMYEFGGDIHKALKACTSTLKEESALQCINGAYMELFNNEILIHEPSFINQQDPLNTCTSMTIKRSDCFLYTPTYFTLNLNWSYEETMESCLNLEENIPRLSCIYGTAAEATNRTQHNLSQVFDLCNRFEVSDELIACVKGASSITVFRSGSIEVALNACKKAGKYTEQCRTYVKEFEPLFIPTY